MMHFSGVVRCMFRIQQSAEPVAIAIDASPAAKGATANRKSSSSSSSKANMRKSSTADGRAASHVAAQVSTPYVPRQTDALTPSSALVNEGLGKAILSNHESWQADMQSKIAQLSGK